MTPPSDHNLVYHYTSLVVIIRNAQVAEDMILTRYWLNPTNDWLVTRESTDRQVVEGEKGQGAGCYEPLGVNNNLSLNVLI